MAKTREDDPAFWMIRRGMLDDSWTSKPIPGIFRDWCYICRDPEYALMGLPLCRKCIICGGHIAADDSVCENGHIEPDSPLDELRLREEHKLEITDELRKLAKIQEKAEINSKERDDGII